MSEKIYDYVEFKIILNNSLKINNCEKLKIENVPSVKDGLDIIKDESFKSSVADLPDLKVLMMCLSETINNVSFKMFSQPKSSFLVTIQSTIGNGGSITCWQVEGHDKIHEMRIDDDTNNLMPLIHEFLVNQINYGRTGVTSDYQNSSKPVRIDQLCDINGQNLLGFATLHKKTEFIEQLLLNDFDPDKVIDLAWDKFTSAEEESEKLKYDEIVFILLKGNSKLPNQFEYEKSSVKIQTFIKVCEELHDLVRNQQLNILKDKIKAEPNLIFFYNRNNESLFRKCLVDCKNFAIENISFFLKNGLKIGNHEDLDETYIHLSDLDKKKIREKQILYSLKNPEEYLVKLILQSGIRSNSGKFTTKHQQYIFEAFDTLSRKEYCKKIMKVAALFKNLNICFDFENDTTYYLDPATSKYTNGVIYEKGSIFIGAIKLLNDTTKSVVYGVLAHELCHFAVYISFMNRNFDPFPSGESDLKRRYVNQVMRQCYQHKESEPIISNVFESYDIFLQASEMIVTVPQMKMQYIHDEAKVEENERIFDELFRYTREVVEPELDRALPILKIILSNEPIQFEMLTETMKAAILNAQINFQGKCVPLIKLIGNDEAVLSHLSSENIKQILVKKETLNIVQNYKLNFEYGYIERQFQINRPYNETCEQLIPISIKTIIDSYKNEGQTSPFIILTDFAGTGKTTTFKKCTEELQNKNPEMWVSFIDLKKCSPSFEKYKNNIKYFDSLIKLVNDFLFDILEIKDIFERQIFLKLISMKKVILLFDGFDEINPKYNQLLEEMLNVFKSSKECPYIWISTRPLYASKLTNILDTFAYKFSIFSEKEIYKFVIEILKVSDLKLTYDEMEDYAKKISTYISSFSNQLQNIKSIDNPLMIQIITELFTDPKMKFDKTDKVNISKLFSAMENKQKTKLENKVSNDEKDLNLMLTIWDVHQVLALMLIIGNNYENKLGFKLDQLSIIKKWYQSKSENEWNNNVIQRYGFVTADIDVCEIDPNTIFFVHRTYAEYFVAKYIAQQLLSFNEDIKDDEIQRRFKLLDLVLSDRWNLEVVQQFIFSYIEMKFDDSKNFKISENIKNLLEIKINEIHKNLEISDSLTIDNHYKCFEDYAKIIKYDEELLNQFWGINPKKNILQYILSQYNNLKIQSYTGHDNNFTKVTQLIEETTGFGQNWYKYLNLNTQELISDEEINKFKDENEEILVEERKLIKLCDFVDKNFEQNKKKMFYSIIDLYSLKNNKIIENLITRIAKIVDKDTFLFNYVPRLDYDKISTQVMKITFTKIESIFEHDKNLIKKFLFKDLSGIDSPLVKAIGSQNIKVFQIVRDFYINYMDSYNDIQNVLQNSFFDKDDEIKNIPEINHFIKTVYSENKII